jgi:hypothetical protein
LSDITTPAQKLRSVMGPRQQAIGVAVRCQACNAVELLMMEVPEPLTLGESTCRICAKPLFLVLGFGSRDRITEDTVRLAMLNAATLLGADDDVNVGVSVGRRTDGPAADGIRH